MYASVQRKLLCNKHHATFFSIEEVFGVEGMVKTLTCQWQFQRCMRWAPEKHLPAQLREEFLSCVMPAAWNSTIWLQLKWILLDRNSLLLKLGMPDGMQGSLMYFQLSEVLTFHCLTWQKKDIALCCQKKLTLVEAA